MAFRGLKAARAAPAVMLLLTRSFGLRRRSVNTHLWALSSRLIFRTAFRARRM